MLYLYYSTIAIAIYFIIGFGITILLMPSILVRLSIFFSPFVGLAAVQLIGWYLYIIGLNGTDSYAIYILITLVTTSIITVSSKKLRIHFELNWAEILPVYFIAYLGFLFVSIPILKQTPSLTTISFGNNDIAYVSLISTFLKRFSRFDSHIFLGQGGVLRELAENSIFGGPFSTAFLCSLLKRDVYEMQTLNLSVFFLFTIPLVYIFARELLNYTKSSSYFLEAIFALNPIIHHIVLCGFQGQVLTTGLSCCIIFINLKALFHARKFRDYAPYIAILTLFNWGISISYGQMLPIIYGVMFFAVLCHSLANKKAQLLVNWLGFFLVGMILLALLSPHRTRALVMLIFFFGGVAHAGWFLRLITPAGIFGYDTKFLFSGNAGFFWYKEIIPIGICVFALFGYLQAFKKMRSVAVTGLSILAIVGLGYLILSYRGRLDTELGGYISFKLLSFFLPMVIACLFVGIDDINLTSKKYNIRGSIIVFLLILIPCLISTLSNISKYKNSYFVSSNLADIKSINNLDQVKSINIMGSDYWQIMWSANFLLEKKLYFQVSSYSGLIASKLLGEWDLLPTCLLAEPLSKIQLGDDVVYINDQYILLKHERYTNDSSIFNLNEHAYHASIHFNSNLEELKSGQCNYFPVNIMNDSSYGWPAFCRWPASRVCVSYRWLDDKGVIVETPEVLSPLPTGLESGHGTVVNTRICSPDAPGSYRLELDLIHNGVWFKDKGSKTKITDVTIR